jgi:Universal stress protein family
MASRWLAVVGVDGSPAAQRALTWAVHEAARRDGAVHIVHVWSRPTRVTPGPVAYPHEARDAAEALVLAAVRSLPARHGVRISTQAVAGEPVSVLRRSAIDADILVLGRDGRGPASIYCECVLAVPCPVMLGGYPIPGEDVNGCDNRPPAARPTRSSAASCVPTAVATR